MVKIELGQVVITRGAAAQLDLGDVVRALGRHTLGDWGDVCEEDKEANDTAARDGYRIVSYYQSNGTKFWVITEWNRSATTILLPEEY